jgi:diguanylate cyclase (GGDEF)-like protein
MLAGIAASFDRASLELGLPIAVPVRPNFGWRGLVLGYAGGLADQVTLGLRGAGYDVQLLPPSADPEGVPVSERADLAVIVGLDGDELVDVGTRWSKLGAARPLAVGLVAASGTLDPFAAPFAGLDFVIDVDRVDTELARFAHTLGQAKTAPRAVLVVSANPSHTEIVSGALESTGVVVSSAASSAEIRSAFTHSPPDLVVVSWTLPGIAGTAVARWMRRLEAHRITPIVALAADLSEQDRILAEQCGVDLVVSASAPKSYLTHAFLSRIDRAFVARTRGHRDDLTGLLSRPALIEELEHQIAHARRAGESISYLVLDLDHFRRINEQRGTVVGDQVLIQVARLVLSAVRAGDFVARMGGEEIGVLLRRCSSENAVKLAEKLRATVAGNPVMADGASIPVRLSVGAATYPDQAASAQDLLRAADRALAAAKAGGRDRVGA